MKPHGGHLALMASRRSSPTTPPTFTLPAKNSSWAWTRSGGCGSWTGTARRRSSPSPPAFSPWTGATAVVRAEVRYGDPLRQEYRDLWVIRLRDDSRSSWFEEWPYWPGRPYSARDDQ